MKTIRQNVCVSLVLLLLSLSCKNEQKQEDAEQTAGFDYQNPQYAKNKALQAILDSANLKGAITLYNPVNKEYFCNNFEWSINGLLPASTFKIPNTIIGLETGIIQSDSTILKWDSLPRKNKTWEKDLVLKEAFQLSCVPCYQKIARDIGVDTMKAYVKRFNYGEMVIDSSNIDKFWLQGDSKISSIQQIEFLEKFYNNKLPISSRTQNLMKNIMLLNSSKGQNLYGKTGWAVANGDNNGWFVGFLESNGQVYYFATNVVPPKNFKEEWFVKIRAEVTMQALKEMKWMR